jgi:hypothetical protein
MVGQTIVAPHAWSWIETMQPAKITSANTVAPHAGAWIETQVQTPTSMGTWRRPPRGVD